MIAGRKREGRSEGGGGGGGVWKRKKGKILRSVMEEGGERQ